MAFVQVTSQAGLHPIASESGHRARKKPACRRPGGVSAGLAFTCQPVAGPPPDGHSAHVTLPVERPCQTLQNPCICEQTAPELQSLKQFSAKGGWAQWPPPEVRDGRRQGWSQEPGGGCVTGQGTAVRSEGHWWGARQAQPQVRRAEEESAGAGGSPAIPEVGEHLKEGRPESPRADGSPAQEPGTQATSAPCCHLSRCGDSNSSPRGLVSGPRCAVCGSRAGHSASVRPEARWSGSRSTARTASPPPCAQSGSFQAGGSSGTLERLPREAVCRAAAGASAYASRPGGMGGNNGL